MKYKMIVSDYDGTLANNEGEISQENLQAILEYQKQGGIFVVSTGRSFSSIAAKLHQYSLTNAKSLIISFQGALVSQADGSVLMLRGIKKSLMHKMALSCEEKGYYFHIYTMDKIYAASDCRYIQDYAHFTKTQEDVVIVNRALSSFIAQSDEQFLKLVLMQYDGDIALRVNKLNDEFSGEIEFVSLNNNFAECVDLLAGKGNALQFLAQHYNIDKSQTVAIGDSMNDYSMLCTAGLGVAVENASEQVKRAAQLTTCTNQQNAVAKIIYKAIANEL